MLAEIAREFKRSAPVLSGNDFHSRNDPNASLTQFKFSIDRSYMCMQPDAYILFFFGGLPEKDT